MNIETLENGDRQLELSQHERDTLIEVVTYLHDHYDDLDAVIRDFTRAEAKDVFNFFETFDVSQPNYFTEKKMRLIFNVLSETRYLIDAEILEENKHWEDVSDNLFDIIFENLKIRERFEGALR
ncbi:MAG: hypothetical protein OEY94_05060 [Alphaproteobacteria bacterium]|nr:hypothetical protein [Alphaproteobacteria bacterium]